MPLVTAVMSIYRPNVEYLAQQLSTIDEQDMRDMDVLVYNDCPEDEDRGGWLRSLCPHHRLTYVHGSENLGYVKAFERLCGMAEGTYLAFCDQDDRWLPGRVEKGLRPLEEGCLLSTCDRQIIDGDGTVTVASWRAAHPRSPETTWSTGDHFAARAAFTCYSIGMATMVRAEVARALMPFPTCTGHDKWLALGANTLGSCAFVTEPLVQHRRWGQNVSGTLRGIRSKRDWFEKRTEMSYRLAMEYVRRFPDSPDGDRIAAFARARKRGDLIGIWRYRSLAPQVAAFEIALGLTPRPLFDGLLGLMGKS